MNALPPGFPETLALPHEDSSEPRRLLDEWKAAYQLTSPIDSALLEQAVTALLAKQRCLRIRLALQTEKVRTAERFWEEDRDNEVYKCRAMFNQSPHRAIIGLSRLAAGLRYLISRWERLETRLAADGTWYGCDRMEGIQLQGLSAMVDDLYFSEDAWGTWRDCLAAQPNPKQPDIDLICRPTVVPKALQDRDVLLWRPDPAESRARLHALVARELPPLRLLEEKYRTQYEEPDRATAKDQALARVTKEETQLLREQRSHERSFEQACSMLLKVGNQTALSDRPPTANGEGVAAPAVGALTHIAKRIAKDPFHPRSESPVPPCTAGNPVQVVSTEPAPVDPGDGVAGAGVVIMVGAVGAAPGSTG